MIDRSMNENVKRKFDTYPSHVRSKLEYLRGLILEVASNTEGVGEIEEKLKWGEPSYITSETKSGTTLRIDWKEENPEKYAVYMNCQTSLIDSYNSLFPGVFSFEGNRAVVFSIHDKLPEEELRVCVQMAFTYHRSKNT
ncbi:MAG: hypothetical protein COA99_06550 [Moraxellaceae bacterium]|nr:MAG: hypothetical protein COA99_06550 [Moraxellaceae bacterium]